MVVDDIFGAGKLIDETKFIKNLENKIRLGVIDENIVASELKAVLQDIRAGAKVKNLDSLLNKLSNVSSRTLYGIIKFAKILVNAIFSLLGSNTRTN